MLLTINTEKSRSRLQSSVMAMERMDRRATTILEFSGKLNVIAALFMFRRSARRRYQEAILWNLMGLGEGNDIPKEGYEGFLVWY